MSILTYIARLFKRLDRPGTQEENEHVMGILPKWIPDPRMICWDYRWFKGRAHAMFLYGSIDHPFYPFGYPEDPITSGSGRLSQFYSGLLRNRQERLERNLDETQALAIDFADYCSKMTGVNFIVDFSCYKASVGEIIVKEKDPTKGDPSSFNISNWFGPGFGRSIQIEPQFVPYGDDRFFKNRILAHSYFNKARRVGKKLEQMLYERHIELKKRLE